MCKYLVQVSYVTDGPKGLLKGDATERREAAEQLIESLGGTIEAFHYAFGGDDLFISANLPDHIHPTASSFVVNPSLAAKVRALVPSTREEVDQVTKRTIVYRPVRE